MDNDRPILGVWMVVHHITNTAAKLEQSVGKWVGMARPLGIMEQYHFSFLPILDQMTKKHYINAKIIVCKYFRKLGYTFVDTISF